MTISPDKKVIESPKQALELTFPRVTVLILHFAVVVEVFEYSVIVPSTDLLYPVEINNDHIKDFYLKKCSNFYYDVMLSS